MTTSPDEIRAIWCQQLAGEQLTDSDRQLLKTALRDDPDLLNQLRADATSHALLCALTDVSETEDSFARAVMQKVATVDQSTVETNSTKPAARRTAELPVLPDGRSDPARRRNSRRRSRQRTALLLTVVLFLAAGLIVWQQQRSQPEIVEAGPQSEDMLVEQQPEPLGEGDALQTINQAEVVVTDDADPSQRKTLDAPDTPPTQLATNGDHTATSRGDFPDAISPKMRQEPLPNVPSQPFVTLTKLQNPVWERNHSIGSRLGNEVVRLFGGTIELTFDDGAVVTLVGPVEFQPLAAGLLDLRRGRLSATVPKPAIGFTVLTPTSDVVDLGTEFEVAVKNTGASDIVLREGVVEVAPGGRDGKNFETWKLTPRGLNRASFYARQNTEQPGPIAAKAEGANGQFRGVISLNGQKAEFRSSEAFEGVRERVMTQFEASQESTQRQWEEFVASLQKTIRGTMNLNGRQMQFGSLDEVMRLHQQLQTQLGPNAATPFTGSISVDGKVIPFRTRKEFEAARRAAFGPAADFGAGDVFDRKRGLR